MWLDSGLKLPLFSPQHFARHYTSSQSSLLHQVRASTKQTRENNNFVIYCRLQPRLGAEGPQSLYFNHLSRHRRERMKAKRSGALLCWRCQVAHFPVYRKFGAPKSSILILFKSRSWHAKGFQYCNCVNVAVFSVRVGETPVNRSWGGDK